MRNILKVAKPPAPKGRRISLLQNKKLRLRQKARDNPQKVCSLTYECFGSALPVCNRHCKSNKNNKVCHPNGVEQGFDGLEGIDPFNNGVIIAYKGTCVQCNKHSHCGGKKCDMSTHECSTTEKAPKKEDSFGAMTKADAKYKIDARLEDTKKAISDVQTSGASVADIFANTR